MRNKSSNTCTESICRKEQNIEEKIKEVINTRKGILCSLIGRHSIVKTSIVLKLNYRGFPPIFVEVFFFFLGNIGL